MKKPMTLDAINFTLVGCTVKILALDDVIEITDFIRDIVENGEEGGFNSTYKPTGWRGTFWHKVEFEFIGWVGKTYEQYQKMAKAEGFPLHEIARVL